jgi:hypothetical protein
LEKAVGREKPVQEVQCHEAFENVAVAELLFGLHWSTEARVVERIDELEDRVLGGQDSIRAQLSELTKLSQRYFLSLFRAQQRLCESHCPNVFAVLPKDRKGWLKNVLGQKVVLHLFCQAPGCWHPVVGGEKGGKYEIKQPAEFFKSMGPYILKLVKVIKYVAPVVGVAAGAYAGLTEQIKLMEELAKKLGERDFMEADLLKRTGVGEKAERIEGMELRALRKLLDEVDPEQEWGGLKKVLTPEGHYFWLCEEHAKEYKN